MYWLIWSTGAAPGLCFAICAFSGHSDVAAPAPLTGSSAGAAALSCGKSDSWETLPKNEVSPTERPTALREDQMQFHLPQRIKL